MKYKLTQQPVLMSCYGIEGVSDSDILIESKSLEEVIKELDWRYLEEDLIKPENMEIGTQYMCFSIEMFGDDELIDIKELYVRI